MWDETGFVQELKELVEKYRMRQSIRFIHRYHCTTRSGSAHCSCNGRNEYVLYRDDLEREEEAKNILER